MQKNRALLLCAVAMTALLLIAPVSYPTYQGRLLIDGSPANGAYDIGVSLYTDNSGGSPVGIPFVNHNVQVTNGLFTVLLPFGTAYFDGSFYYLELKLGPAGGTNMTTLSPRQSITPTPSALYATTSGTATTVSGTGSVPLSALPAQLITNGQAGVNFSGAFIGDGSGLTNVATGSLATSGSQSLPPRIYSTYGTYDIVVPAGVSSARVQLWGAGGKSVANFTTLGGGGAYTANTFSVTPGQICTVVVGASGFYLGGRGSGNTPGGSGSLGGGTGGQASSVFLKIGGNYLLEGVAGGGGGGGQFGPGGAGGNPGEGAAGGYNGVGGGAGSSSAGHNYGLGASTTGLSSLSQAAGGGGDSTVLNAGGGGGGYGGGAGAGQGTGLSASGGGSYGAPIIGGSGPNAGNTGDPNYQAGAGSSDHDGLVVVTFIASPVSFANYVAAPEFIGDGSFLSNLRVQNLVFDTNSNTWLGNGALSSNLNGMANTAIGTGALSSNTTGSNNVAVGYNSALRGTTANYNVAVGDSALLANTNGAFNTAVGHAALIQHPSGTNNTAVGSSVLYNHLNGNDNTGLGSTALLNLTNGTRNLALGRDAGLNLSAGSNNIYLANNGNANENNTIRIGTPGTQTDTYLSGLVHGSAGQFTGNVIAGSAATPLAAMHVVGAVDAQLRLQDTTYGNHWSIYTEAIVGNPAGSGNLLFNSDAGAYGYISKINGSYASSSDARLKKDIADLGSVLDRVLRLRPVSYRFKKNAENAPLTDGFLAQEVEPLFPEVVSEVNGFKGISYSELVPVTVGAIQELNQKLEKKDAEIDALKQSIAELKAAVRELSKTTPESGRGAK